MMDEQEEKDLWIAVWAFSGQSDPGIKYLNVFPGEKIFSLREDQVRGHNIIDPHHIDVVIAVSSYEWF